MFSTDGSDNMVIEKAKELIAKANKDRQFTDFVFYTFIKFIFSQIILYFALFVKKGLLTMKKQ